MQQICILIIGGGYWSVLRNDGSEWVFPNGVVTYDGGFDPITKVSMITSGTSFTPLNTNNDSRSNAPKATFQFLNPKILSFLFGIWHRYVMVIQSYLEKIQLPIFLTMLILWEHQIHL